MRDHWKLVGLTVLVTITASLLWLANRPTTYEATARLLVTPLPQDDTTYIGLPLIRDSGDPTQTVQTAAALITQPTIDQATARRLGHEWTSQDVQTAVSVQQQGQSNVLAVTASAPTADAAATIANDYIKAIFAVRTVAIHRQAVALVNDLRAHLATLPRGSAEAATTADRLNSIATLKHDPTLTASSPAQAPSSPSGPSAPLIVGLAIIAGLALGVGAALLVESFDKTVRSEDELLDLYPLPVLARVPRTRRSEESSTAGLSFSEPMVGEAFRTLYVQLGTQIDRGSLLITSGSKGDGKTSTVINLGIVAAAHDRRVLLLDMDLRNSELGATLGVPPHERRLGYALDPRTPLGTLVADVPQLPGVRVLAANLTDGPSAVGAFAHRLPSILAEAQNLADLVIVDSPPLGAVSDALTFAGSVDHILLVARPGNTARAGIEQTRDLLTRSGKVPIGIVVIGATETTPEYYHANGRREVGRVSLPVGTLTR